MSFENFTPKTLALLTVAVVIFTTGCFGLLQKKTVQQAVEEQATNVQEQMLKTSENESENIVAPAPSFQDGEFYFEAISSNKAAICAKIQNFQLKGRCLKEIKNL